MVEDLNRLIEKINQEGIKRAEDKAGKIETEAKQRAEAIIKEANDKAKKIFTDAKDETAKMKASGETSLRQAARDVIISLKKEITATLEKIVLLELRDELTAEAMAKIIGSLIKNYKGEEGAEVIVTVGKEDLKKMEAGLLAKLKDEVKKGITLRQSDDIRTGFTISYDSGRSHYDFTDKALAEHISLYLKPKLAELLNIAEPSVKKKA